MRLDFVVVSFEGEFASLLLQARSLARSNAADLVTRYHILWNDTHGRAQFDTTFLPRLQAELRDSRLDWTVLLRNEILDEAFLQRYGSNGDRVQQLLKLLSARFCTADALCILDTKNHVVRPLDVTDFAAADGSLRCHGQSYPPTSPFNPWFRAALDYFGVDDAERAVSSRPALPSTTPYVMSRPVILDMIETVERKQSMSFADAFMQHEVVSRTTEFLLYCAFVLSRFGDVRGLYTLSRRNYVTFFNKSPEGDEAIGLAIEETRRPDVKFVGFHRRRRSRLTGPEKAAFLSLWSAAGLFPSEQAGRDFLESETI